MARSERVQQWVTKAFEYSFPSVAAVKEELKDKQILFYCPGAAGEALMVRTYCRQDQKDAEGDC